MKMGSCEAGAGVWRLCVTVTTVSRCEVGVSSLPAGAVDDAAVAAAGCERAGSGGQRRRGRCWRGLALF